MEVLCICIHFNTTTKNKAPGTEHHFCKEKHQSGGCVWLDNRNALLCIHFKCAGWDWKVDGFFRGSLNFRSTVVFQLSLTRRTVSSSCRQMERWALQRKTTDVLWIVTSLGLNRLRLLPQPYWAGDDFWEEWFCLVREELTHWEGQKKRRGKSQLHHKSSNFTNPMIHWHCLVPWLTAPAQWWHEPAP